MTKDHFIQLDMDQKIKILYCEGCFILDIRYYSYKINLYLVKNFYVEVFYNHKLDKIDKISLMGRNHSRTKFYADQISLPNGLLV